jgi:hypothetical protein
MNKIIWIILFVTLVSFGIVQLYNFIKRIEVNTVNPQTCKSIKQSKENSVFIAEYILDTSASKNKIIIQEAWIETVWKNSFIDNKQKIENLGGIQLALSTNSFKEVGYDETSFLLNKWKLKIDKEELQGSGKGNGVFIFYLKDDSLPNKIKVTAQWQDKNREQISFVLRIKN